MRRPIIYILAGIVFVGALAVAWYLASPLFINQTVDEPFPVVVPAPEQLEKMTEDELSALEGEYMEALPPEEQIAEMPEQERKELEDKTMQIAQAMPEKQVVEPMPTMVSMPTADLAPESTATPAPEPTATIPAEPELVLEGQFYGADDFHQGMGDALIYKIPGEGYFLRLENFEVTNGPQLHVILGVDANPFNHATLGEYLDLGPLKGNIGDQNYAIPAGTELSEYGSVVIYCVPFRAIFAIAPIS
jgi:hypothetical protein